MTPKARMFVMNMMNEDSKGGERYSRNDDYRRESNYDTDSRFRDRRGREHYDNGRFAPMRSEYDDDDIDDRYSYYGRDNGGVRSERRMDGDRMERREDGRRDMWYPDPIYRGEGMRNRIGFTANGGMERVPDEMDHSGSRAHVGYERMDEMDRRGGNASMGRASSVYVAPFDMETAEHWLKGLKNADGTRGPHWPLETTKQIQAQRGIDCDPIEFWAAMNIMYSDYYSAAKANNAHNQAFYADMAKAFLEDKDAEDDKLALYYKYVVKK